VTAELLRRIIINGRFLGQATTGVQRYATEVVRGFDRLLEQGAIDSGRYDIQIAVPRGTNPRLMLRHMTVQEVGRLRGHAWEQVELSRFVPDGLLVNLCNVAPVLRRRQVVTIHDASVFATPEAYSIGFRLWYRVLLSRLAHRATRVLTVSEFSRAELARYCEVEPGRLHVIHHGGDHLDSVVPDNSILTRHGLEGNPYVLAVGSRAPHKNFGALLRAIPQIHGAMPDVKIVIVGGRFPRVFGVGELEAEDALYTGYVSDAELKALYRHARCFVFPSVYEGFGLPPLEAMACECPVVAARAASLPEVCGDAAAYFDPHDPGALAGVILGVLGSRSLELDLRARGLARAGTFTWLNCARRTFGVLEQALAS
jgi:glycosyltransferase involved in cell wall biosynthesis